MAYSLKFINDDAYLFNETDIAMLTMDEEDSVEVDENDSECKKLDNSNIIRNISFDQSEILHNIMHLYNNDEPFDCDMTASELKFYQKVKGNKYVIPEPKILFDVFPKEEKIKKIEPFGRLPLEDNSIGSIVVDLPFVISPKACKSVREGKKGANLISNRFSSFYPAEELIETIYWFIKECYRVVKENGIVVWKMQSTVSGGRQVWASYFSFLAAQKIGFYVKDEFILQSKSRLISASKIKKQQHARKYTSTFYVFQKDKKLFEKNSLFKWLKMCEEQDKNGELEGKKWPLK